MTTTIRPTYTWSERWASFYGLYVNAVRTGDEARQEELALRCSDKFGVTVTEAYNHLNAHTAAIFASEKRNRS